MRRESVVVVSLGPGVVCWETVGLVIGWRGSEVCGGSVTVRRNNKEVNGGRSVCGGMGGPWGTG